MAEMREVLFALVLLAAGLAGCVGADEASTGSAETASTDEARTMAERANVTGIPAELDEIQPVDVEASDGAHLRGHTYLPKGEGPFASVLILTPYANIEGPAPDTDELDTEEDGRRTMVGAFGPLMDAGFAVSVVNVRGTGASDGCVQYGGPRAVEDAGEVVEALAAAAWSNGNVGMVGASYSAKTQYMAIASGAPSLEAVVPISSVLDHWQLATRNGAWIENEPMSRYVGGWSLPGTVHADSPGPTVMPDRANCPEYAEDFQGTGGVAVDGDKNAWYQARDYSDEIANTTVPMYVTNGLTNGEGHILQVQGLWNLMPEDRRLLLGQWPHDLPHNHVEDWDDEVNVWFDHYLRGGPKEVETGIVEYQDTSGTWHNATEWPPAGNETTLHLSGTNLIQDRRSVSASEQIFQSQPDRARPSTCGGTKAFYVSEPLADEVVLAGSFHANLTVTSTQPDGHFAAVLWHVEDPWPCQANPPAAGGDDLEDHEVALALTDLAHRGHLEQGEPFPVSEPDVMQMTSEPHATQVPAGHRLALTVAGGDSELFPQPPFPQLTVQTGTEVAGELKVNAVEGELVFGNGNGTADAKGNVPLQEGPR